VTDAVLLDFYGTLAHATTWGPTRQEVLAARGFEVPDDVVAGWRDDTIDGAEHVEHSVSGEAYEAWERGRMRRFVLACGVGADDADLLVDDLYTATKSFRLEAYPEVPGVLADLRRTGIKLAVCSNWDWHLDRALAQAGLDGLFDVVVTSARAGARKPHPRIFRHTLGACGVEPESAVFAGDSWGPDVEGPAAVGMRPVHVWRPEWDGERDPPPPLADGIVRLPDLRGLVDLV
jgi:putative hydrolase of the HAD superfamily